jgi:DNA-binding response OmpR family regulator
MDVLLIEDDSAIVQDLKNHFKDKPFTLSATGFACYNETLKAFKPDLIILDIKNGGLGEDLGAQGGKNE